MACLHAGADAAVMKSEHLRGHGVLRDGTMSRDVGDGLQHGRHRQSKAAWFRLTSVWFRFTPLVQIKPRGIYARVGFICHEAELIV